MYGGNGEVLWKQEAVGSWVHVHIHVHVVEPSIRLQVIEQLHSEVRWVLR